MDVFRKLGILERRGFIAKRYFAHYQLLHKPVVYYLLPLGARKIREYRDESDTDGIDGKRLYRDRMVGEPFVMHCIAVFDLYNRLMAGYGDDLDFLSKNDQASFNDFPEPLPDAFLNLQADAEARHFFLDILDDDTHLLIDASKKIQRYFAYRSSGKWATMGAAFPVIIFVCSSEVARNKVQKRCDYAMRKAWVRDIEFRVVTTETVSLG